jgi:PBSX family phage terminase large subunit
MNIGFSPKQIEVLKFGYENYDAVICDGSVRSGKTSVLILSFVMWAMSNFKNQNFAISSKSITSGERNLIKPLLNIKYMHDNYDIKYTQRVMIVTRGNVVNYFYLFGGQDESSYQSVQGITLAGVLLDEVVLMPESFVNQILARCSVKGSKFWFSCNPESPNHWFYKNWVLDFKTKNAKYLHFTMDDNPSLDKEIVKRYETMYTGVFYDRYIKGLWVRAEGVIYKEFADHPEKFIIENLDDEELIMVNVGVDFGGNNSAHTFVATGFTKGMEKVIVLESKRVLEKISPQELDNIFADFCDMVYNRYGKAFNSRCDNAEPVLMRGLKNIAFEKKLRTNVKGALKKPIKTRIDLVVRLLGEQRLLFLKGSTEVLQKGLREAIWDPKKEDQRLDDLSTDIDILDAFEYSIEEFTNMIIDV